MSRFRKTGPIPWPKFGEQSGLSIVLTLAMVLSIGMRTNSCVRAQEHLQTVFHGGQTIQWKVSLPEIDSPVDVSFVVSWDGTVVQQGTQRTSREQPDLVSIPMELETVEDILELQVTLRWRPNGSTKLTKASVPLLVVSRNLLARRSFSGSMKVALFDRPGKTRTAFTDGQLPFEDVDDLESFQADASKLLIVGEGTNWKRRRVLAEKLEAILAAGTDVVVLAPSHFLHFIPITDVGEMRTGTATIPEFLGRYPTSFKATPIPLSINQKNQKLVFKTQSPGFANWLWISNPQRASVLVIQEHVTVNPDRGSANRLDNEQREANTNSNTTRRGSLLVLGQPLLEQWDDNPSGKLVVLELLEFMAGQKLLDKE